MHGAETALVDEGKSRWENRRGPTDDEHWEDVVGTDDEVLGLVEHHTGPGVTSQEQNAHRGQEIGCD
ncbi:hypothetical protein [Nitrococcus mobilis]|uniref:hypothetical protein n=1 Tax=Nitrococcus mobilis TaxID=35797 RepID=UPI0002F41C39|nr:hypothetical protein [Nitrococcus mobilis]